MATDLFPPGFAPDPQRWGAEVVVMHPRSFAAVQEALLLLRDHVTVLLNLSGLPTDQLQRAVDFMAGGACALDASVERLGDAVWLFAPHCVALNHDPSPST